jgi:hypothetical protein
MSDQQRTLELRGMGRAHGSRECAPGDELRDIDPASDGLTRHTLPFCALRSYLLS